MGKNLVIVILGIICISAMALTADAQMCGCMGGPGGMMEGKEHKEMGMMHGMGGMQESGMMMDGDQPMWKHLMSIGLDEKQTEALKALRSKTMKEMIKKMSDKQIAGLELKDLLDKDPVDMKAVETSAKKIEALRTEMFLAHIRALEEVKSILTPEQRKRFKEMMASGHGAGCGMMGGDDDHKDMHMHEHMH